MNFLTGHYFQLILLICTKFSSQQRQLPNRIPTPCASTFSSRRFHIYLPRSDKEDRYECEFRILQGDPQVCRLRIEFQQFQLLSSKSCHEEFLQVGNRRLCGSISGAQFARFLNNSLEIRYRGNSKQPMLLELQQELCNQQSLPSKNCDLDITKPEQEILSPNYPDQYSAPISCRYTIKPSVDNNVCSVEVKFLDFNLPDSEDCLIARLMINGKAYCGYKPGWTVAININQTLTVDFSAAASELLGNFRLLVKQIPCETKRVSNSSANQVALHFPPHLPCARCCNRVFDSSNFIIHSPGFLELPQPTDFNCVYQIVPSSRNVCRLRFNFVHFWLGREDVYYGCTDSFVEIDGRRWCGCKDGLMVVSYFQGIAKDVFLNIRGPQNRGFIIEVHQEDCRTIRGRNEEGTIAEVTTINPNNEVEIFSTNSSVEKVRSRFLVPSDAERCYQWGLPQWLEKIKAILASVGDKCPAPHSPPNYPNFPPLDPSAPWVPPSFPFPEPQPPVLPPDFPQYSNPPPVFPNPNPIPPLPNFPGSPIPPENPIQPPILPPNLHPRPPPPPIFPPYPEPPVLPPLPQPRPPIIPSPPIQPPILPPNFPQNPIQPPLLPQPPHNCPSFPQPPILPPIHTNPPLFPPRCQVLSSLQGSFHSPGYPWEYPPNQKCCYRIRQANGFCRLQLVILDFDLVWSPKCWKDYFLIDKTSRYCGQSLQSSVVYLPFKHGFAYADFISDGYLAGRGFNAKYWQLPCRSSYLRKIDSVDEKDDVKAESRPGEISQGNVTLIT